MKKWETPKLIVLIRPKERGVLEVIQICKGAGSYTLGPSMNDVYRNGEDAGLSCFYFPEHTPYGPCAVCQQS